MKRMITAFFASLALVLATGGGVMAADTRHLGYHDCRGVSYGDYVSAYSRADGSNVQRHTYISRAAPYLHLKEWGYGQL